MTEYIVIPRSDFMQGFQVARGKVTEWFLKQLDSCDTIVSDDDSQDTLVSQKEPAATQDCAESPSSPTTPVKDVGLSTSKPKNKNPIIITHEGFTFELIKYKQ